MDRRESSSLHGRKPPSTSAVSPVSLLLQRPSDVEIGKGQSTRSSVQRMMIARQQEPFGPLRQDQISLGKAPIGGYLTRWSGTVTERTWPIVLAYAVYLTAVALFFHLGCDDDDPQQQHSTTFFPERCSRGPAVTTGPLWIAWLVVTGVLWVLLVQAGLYHFQNTLQDVRTIQSRLEEISLLLHTFYYDNDGPGNDTTALAAALRLLVALPFFLFTSTPHFGLEQTTKMEEYLTQAGQYLEPEEMERLANIPTAADRPYAMLFWIPKLVLDESMQPPPPQTPLLVRAVGRLRDTHAGLVDRLEDAVLLPLPWIHLVVTNLYLVLAALPFVLDFGYAVIPWGTLLFWVLDGMITFVLVMVREPFSATTRRPLIDLRQVVDQSVLSLTRRFPAALQQYNRKKQPVEYYKSL
ncbi:expressed unknown protein [Seminavis robusta]|uniref:Uncharacterized protein n=1 Tax=Seminavis robusta TaxID=568900 RepID=A0A9N8ESP3_9STRA|nr:expressed unknown protein [Seminavis robusta]|eukprot:Sro1569_g283160.1 n/a (409) ;mRNA; f:16717-17943